MQHLVLVVGLLVRFLICRQETEEAKKKKGKGKHETKKARSTEQPAHEAEVPPGGLTAELCRKYSVDLHGQAVAEPSKQCGFMQGDVRF